MFACRSPFIIKKYSC